MQFDERGLLQSIAPYVQGLTLTGLGGHICPSLVKDWKDIYVPLLWLHDGVIATSLRAS